MAYFIHALLVEDAGNDKDNNKCIDEQVMREEIDHLTKMVSTCNINRHLNIMSEVITFLGNCWLLDMAPNLMGHRRGKTCLCPLHRGTR